MTARSLVQHQSPPSTYAIAAWVDKEPGAGGRVVGLTVERAFFIGTGLLLAGFRGADVIRGALTASAAVTGWIWADYSLRLRGKTGLTPWSSGSSYRKHLRNKP